MKEYRELLKEKKRIVIKIGSSSIIHANTGRTNLAKLEQLARIISDIKNQGKEVVLVSSGAIGVGVTSLGLSKRPSNIAQTQACAAIGQGKLMMIYQKLFAEYGHTAAQVLLTKDIMLDDERRTNAKNTFNELLRYDVIPVVNENDTVSTEEIEFGDNDTLSAIVTALIGGDLLILLSDIDGLYTDDPNVNKDAKFIDVVAEIDDNLRKMGKGSVSNVGTGGMATKIAAAAIATDAGADMIIANGDHLSVLNKILSGVSVGTLFLAHKNQNFKLADYLENKSLIEE